MKKIYLVFIFFLIIPSPVELVENIVGKAKDTVSLATNFYCGITNAISLIKNDIYHLIGNQFHNLKSIITYFPNKIISATSSFTGDVKSVIKNVYNIITGGLSFINEVIYFANTKELEDMTPTNGEEYDFIIVGAGSAGAVMANRLSEIENVTILLIEAGPKEYLFEDIPIVAPYLQFFGSINYKYKTEPSKNYCRGMINNQCSWSKGKVMGGSSVLNYMVATRGNHENYNEWASMGNEGWSFNNLLKYFRKLETFDCLPIDKDYHGFNGPMYISNAPYRPEISQAFFKATAEMGFPIVDYDGKEQIGFAYTHGTVHSGERWSSNRGYLHPIRDRRNLFLTRNSHVDRILVDPSIKKAYGVSFTKGRSTIDIKAKKEVILCAGSIESPKLLMLSGIGPANQLKESGIETVKDLPGVGENLIDHFSYWNLMFTVNDSVSIVSLDLLFPINPAFGDYLKKRKGASTLTATGDVVGFVNVDNLETRQGLPNVEYFMSSTSVGSDLFYYKVINIDNDHYKATFQNMLGKQSFMILIVLLSPKSRGRIVLNSKNPKSKPLIYPNYLSEPEDVQVLTKGIRFAIKFSKTKAMQKYNATLVKNPILGCENLELYSDEYWECALRTFGTTAWHPVGTCKMGPSNDSLAVVDSRLKVYGIDKLRVVDASIMPTIISGHPNVPIMAIAEKAADMIKEDWEYVTK